MRQIEKAVLLQTLDHLWREHLVTLEHLRQVIGLRGYGQRDPLNEYKNESFTLFEHMLARLREAVTGQLMHVQLAKQEEVPPLEPAELPPMEAHHLDPTDRRGRVRAGNRRSRPAMAAAPGHARPEGCAPRPLRRRSRTRPILRAGARCSGTRSARAAPARNTSTATARWAERLTRPCGALAGIRLDGLHRPCSAVPARTRSGRRNADDRRHAVRSNRS